MKILTRIGKPIKYMPVPFRNPQAVIDHPLSEAIINSHGILNSYHTTVLCHFTRLLRQKYTSPVKN